MLTVKKCEIFGFLGPNGAGKSITLRMLTTLLPIDEGEAAVCGFDLKLQQNDVRRHIRELTIEEIIENEEKYYIYQTY